MIPTLGVLLLFWFRFFHFLLSSTNLGNPGNKNIIGLYYDIVPEFSIIKAGAPLSELFFCEMTPSLTVCLV